MTDNADPVRGETARAEDRPSQAGRATSYWHHFSCRECPWSRSVQINAKPGTIRKGFRLIGEHVAAHRESA